jgi:hypothetical protein
MNRKIAALALVAATMLLGACGGNEPQPSASDQSVPPEEPTTTWAPQDLALVDVAVQKPPPGAPKVEPTAIPEELSNFSSVPGLSEQQQDCLNGALKQAVDTDPSLTKTPGKRASLSGTAITVCDGSNVFTDPLVDGLAGGESNSKITLTPQQSQCFKQAFATDKQGTSKVIAASMIIGSSPDMNVDGIKQALAPFEAKCGAKLSDALAPNS